MIRANELTRYPAGLASLPPAAVHRYFAGLSGAEQVALATRYPALVGRLDGAPPALRYAANRRRMRTTPYRAWPGRYLLFDPRDGGRLALVYGDLSTADRIGVLVPGAGNRAADFLPGLGGMPHRAPAVQAAHLYRAARTLCPDAPGGDVPCGGTKVAVVAWLGYRTPRGLGISAAREDLAAVGAAELVRFASGLVAIRPQSTVTVLGHSYGSVVVGLAARRLSTVGVADHDHYLAPGTGSLWDLAGIIARPARP